LIAPGMGSDEITIVLKWIETKIERLPEWF